MNRRLPLIIISALVIVMFLFTSVFAEGEASGTCGTDLTWEFVESEATMYIHGTGEMTDYGMSSYRYPWVDLQTKIKAVVIDEGVTTIGNYAFYNCNNIESVSIPDTIVSIGDGAFQKCSALKELVLPSSLESLGSYAFASCSSIEYVELPYSLQETERSIFYSCTNLKTIDIYSNIEIIETSSFSGCTSLETVNIHTYTIVSIKNEAFSGCTSLTKIDLKDPLEYIGSDAFYNCISLASIDLPDTLTTLGVDAFESCKSLVSVTIPSSLTTVSGFSKCSNLKNVSLPANLKSIGISAFYGCTALEHIDIPDSVQTIGESAFRYCYALQEIDFPASLNKLGSYAFEGCRSLTSVDIPSGITEYGMSIFNGCTALTDVTLPDDIPYIEMSMFSACSSLEQIVLPESVTAIYNGAFANCTVLKTITMYNGVKSIGPQVFEKSLALSDIYYHGTPEEFAAINVSDQSNGSFLSATVHYMTWSTEKEYQGIMKQGPGWTLKWWLSCSVDENENFLPYYDVTLEIYLTGENTKAGSIDLLGNNGELLRPWLDEVEGLQIENITYLTIMGSTINPITISADAFKDHTGLDTLELKAVDEICDRAFMGCTSLKIVRNENRSIKLIGDSAFEGDLKLTNFLMTNWHLRSVGTRAFYDCAKMIDMTLLDDVEYIGTNAFAGCFGITLKVYENSYAHEYAEECGIPYDLLDYPVPRYLIDASNEYGYKAYYQDQLFWKNDGLNMDIAKIASLMCAYAGGYSAYGIVDFYEKMDIPASRVAVANYETYPDVHLIDENYDDCAFSLAFKDILDENGESAYLVMITARGSIGHEFLLDRLTTATEKFYGQKAYDLPFAFYVRIKNGLAEFFNEHPAIIEKPIKFLITGHSLGGAAANLVGADLIKNADELPWDFDKDDVYVYTFGAIDSIETYGYTVYSGYENIHNIYNTNDTFGPGSKSLTNQRIITTTGNSMIGKFGVMHLFTIDYTKMSDFLFDSDAKNHIIEGYMKAVFEFPDAISYEPAVRYRVGCPVDVDVYYNEELVCRISDDIVDEDLTIIPAWVVDDVKYFVIPQNDNYRVVITARDEGTVNCSIEKGGSESPEAMYFENISIEAGDILTSDYHEYDILEDVHLYLDDGVDITEIPGVNLAVYNGDKINVIPYVSDEIVGYGIFPDLREVSVPLDIPCKVGYYDEASGKYIAIEPIVYISNAAFILPEGIEEVILVVKGDADLSGEFDFFDVVTAKAMDLYPDESYSPVQLFAADVDDDGDFGFFDVILIKAADLGKTLLSW